MGPTGTFHLGADGGLAEFCDNYTASFNRWWDGLGHPHLDAETAARLVTGIEEAAAGTPHRDLMAQRDALLTAVVAATRQRRS